MKDSNGTMVGVLTGGRRKGSIDQVKENNGKFNSSKWFEQVARREGGKD